MTVKQLPGCIDERRGAGFRPRGCGTPVLTCSLAGAFPNGRTYWLQTALPGSRRPS